MQHIIVEFVKIPGEVMYVKLVFMADLVTTINLKHEPVRVTFCISIYFHKEIIFCFALDIRGVQVTAFKVLIELQYLVSQHLFW